MTDGPNTVNAAVALEEPCWRCGDTGYVAVEDPILGGLIDTRCPECAR